jgi:hypothetical protein
LPEIVQLSVDRLDRPAAPCPGIEIAPAERARAERAAAEAEAAARRTLRAQVARLERELSRIVTRSFPHVSAAPAPPVSASSRCAVPHLLGLAELELARDALAARVADARRCAAERSALERRSRELLRRAHEDPRRYKFLRIPMADLGEGTCGAWEVRPRLGPIGMLAGWWQLKLSSGCP